MTDLFGDPLIFLQRLVLQIPALLLAITVHEVAHGVVADRLGDPTARLSGRLTLNPLPHIDPLGRSLSCWRDSAGPNQSPSTRTT